MRRGTGGVYVNKSGKLVTEERERESSGFNGQNHREMGNEPGFRSIEGDRQY